MSDQSEVLLNESVVPVEGGLEGWGRMEVTV